MSALEKMREAFETCTVMAGVEPDFECIYITKDVANALFDEAEAENAKLRDEFRKMDEWHSKELIAAMSENAKLRELVRDVVLIAYCSGSKVLDMQVWAKNADHRTIAERMRELGIYREEL